MSLRATVETLLPAHLNIPNWDAYWYAQKMSIQIAIRLPDEMVRFLDETVASGNAPSRAAIVSSAIEHEMRRRLAQRDAELLRQRGAADDLDALVDWTAPNLKIDLDNA
ncbi:hypothetical protein SAMN06309944_1479 [Micrococcales bacterium KH10]|nr:hypothetical protein SAMN06309944_1479 [Micrococcales bacterium KH10]